MAGMEAGTILGHEAVGVVEAVGDRVRGFSPGDRVVVNSTISCGVCALLPRRAHRPVRRRQHERPGSGHRLLRRPAATGPIDGLQAEYARVPWAPNTLIPLPDDGQRRAGDPALRHLPHRLVRRRARRRQSRRHRRRVRRRRRRPVRDRVGVPAGRRPRVRDRRPRDRLAQALAQNAEVIDFNAEDPVEVVKELTGGVGVDAVIDAVGVDADDRSADPAAAARRAGRQFEAEVEQVGARRRPQGDQWVPGDAPPGRRWAVEAVAKAGRIGIIGVYPPHLDPLPDRRGDEQEPHDPHGQLQPPLGDTRRSSISSPRACSTRRRSSPSRSRSADAIDAYEAFDRREEGWLKVELTTGA